MEPITMAMLGLAAANAIGNIKRERDQKLIEASKAEWSPWTGVHAGEIKYANPIGDLANAAGTYAASEAAARDAADRKNFNNRLLGIEEAKAGMAPGSSAVMNQIAPAKPQIDTNHAVPQQQDTAWLNMAQDPYTRAMRLKQMSPWERIYG